MKRILLSLALTCLAILPARANLVFYESFNYTNGPIVVTSTNGGGTTNWFHTGGATAADCLINNRKLEVSATGGIPVSRAEDVNRPFTSDTNSTIVVYASLTVNCTNLPPAVGTYFAHFMNPPNTFHGRVFAQAGSLPGTWRLGIAGAAGTASKIYPADLSTNVDYQVAVQWDPVTSFGATLWVNPIASTDPSVTSIDTVATPPTMRAFGIRQASSFGNFFCTISNLAAATTFEEATTNVWSTNAVAPIVIRSPAGGTNYVADVVNLISLAAGQGQGNLNYQWTRDGAYVSNPNGNSNVFNIVSAAIGDTGNYQMIVTTPFGLSATSSPAFLWVTNAPVPPTISQQPSNSTVFFHQTAQLHLVAGGPPTLSYTWSYNNGALGPNVSGDGTDTITITDVTTTNGTAGTYKCVVSNPYGNITSSNAVLTAVAPPAVSIAYLRTLVDPVNYLATNSFLRWTATGTVTTFTNLTTGNTSSYYLQDGTAGINIFITGASTFRPTQGDVVTFVGFLSSFSSSLELGADATDPTTSWTVLSNNIAGLPAPRVIPFNITNNLPLMEYNIEGSVVMLTNVYFGANAGTTNSTTANTTIVVTNAGGETFTLFFSAQDQDMAGQTLPSFAWTVRGVLSQNLGNAVTPRNQLYNVTVTRFADIVTTAPITFTGTPHVPQIPWNWFTLDWTAVPYDYAYSVQAATSVAGPYTTIAAGLTFTTANGTYTDTNAGTAYKFYRVSSP